MKEYVDSLRKQADVQRFDKEVSSEDDSMLKLDVDDESGAADMPAGEDIENADTTAPAAGVEEKVKDAVEDVGEEAATVAKDVAADTEKVVQESEQAVKAEDAQVKKEMAGETEAMSGPDMVEKTDAAVKEAAEEVKTAAKEVATEAATAAEEVKDEVVGQTETTGEKAKNAEAEKEPAAAK